MSPEVLSLVGAVVAILGAIAGGIFWWMNRTPSIPRDVDEILPLFGSERDEDGQQWVGDKVEGYRPTPPSSRPVTPTGSRPVTPAFGEPVLAHTPAESFAPVIEPPGGAGSAGRLTPLEVLRAVQEPKPTIRTFTTGAADTPPRSATPVRPSRPVPSAPLVPVTAHGVPGTMIEGELLRFSVPAEGTLQFLPGRFQIAAGLDSGREIRFVHVPGPDGTVVTFGRSEGALYRHIQLRDQTVSRSHARMRLLEGQWLLLNLSQTNPVVHNGRVLASGEEQLLTDGDRIEMGEVLFTFRDR
ncbi:MAG: FHA domain-containing protein [Gemmatimonadaceae bacterium]|nr:FHA domain-containing protein [Gemmatimonadaceae bacterium]